MSESFQAIGCFFIWLKSLLFGQSETRLRLLDEKIANGLTLRVDKNGYELFSGGKSCAQFSGIDDLALGLRLALNEAGKPGIRKINLQMAPKQYLYRSLSDVNLPDYRVRKLSEMDSVMQTPFEQSEIVLLNDVRDGAGCGYFLLKKILVEPIADVLKSQGLRCDLISFSGQEKAVFPARLVGELFGAKATRIPNWVPIFGILTMMLGTFVHFHLRYAEANQELDQKIAALNVEVHKIRATIAERDRQDQLLSSVLQLKNGTTSRVELWEELSRILPDGSWLAALHIGDGVIKATGYSKSAASLIEIVNASAYFHEATFDGSVVSIAKRDVQRFTIRAGVAAP